MSAAPGTNRLKPAQHFYVLSRQATGEPFWAQAKNNGEPYPPLYVDLNDYRQRVSSKTMWTVNLFLHHTAGHDATAAMCSPEEHVPRPIAKAAVSASNFKGVVYTSFPSLIPPLMKVSVSFFLCEYHLNSD
jgi:hypothetical protein